MLLFTACSSRSYERHTLSIYPSVVSCYLDRETRHGVGAGLLAADSEERGEGRLTRARYRLGGVRFYKQNIICSSSRAASRIRCLRPEFITVILIWHLWFVQLLISNDQTARVSRKKTNLDHVVVYELPEVHHQDWESGMFLSGVGLQETLGYHTSWGEVVGPATWSIVPGMRELYRISQRNPVHLNFQTWDFNHSQNSINSQNGKVLLSIFRGDLLMICDDVLCHKLFLLSYLLVLI